MNFFKKLKSGNFWVSLISAGVLIAEGIFDVEIKTEYLNQIILGLMGVLTVFGIVSNHGNDETILQNKTSTETTEKDVEEISSVSNIRSICDTINLLLNKVSINSSNQESDDNFHNEIVSVLEKFKEEKMIEKSKDVQGDNIEKTDTFQADVEVEEINNFESEKIVEDVDENKTEESSVEDEIRLIN